MQYIVAHIALSINEEYVSDLLSYELGNIGFESFVKTDSGLDAFAQEQLFDREAFQSVVDEFDTDSGLTFEIESVENEDWNEVWEKNFFTPIVIEDKCVVRSTFHTDTPKLLYDIIINPKMAFGTGHHETTRLMISNIIDMNLEGKNVLDMGCGTSILAILAAMKGAEKITAIDIDDWCVDNSQENIELNGVNNIEVELGDASLLAGRKFDVVIANINRNILLNDIPTYAATLSEGGVLTISGFFTEDEDMLVAKAAEEGLHLEDRKSINNWAALLFKKSY